jgi:uncharacterized protein (DUF362 family)
MFLEGWLGVTIRITALNHLDSHSTFFVATRPIMKLNRPARVAITHTAERHRTLERVLPLVREALDLVGGISRYVAPGSTVLLKPNQTVYYSAEEGCTTDPLVVQALIRLARQAGAGRIIVAESSGEYFSSIECMKITGLAAVAEKEGAELLDLGSDETPNRIVPIPDGRVLHEAPIPVPLLEADVIIDVPKAKNHHIDPITGALKNWVGTVNRTWRNSHHGDLDMFGRFMDIMSVTRPHLTVTDALIIGEGDGPVANTPRWCGCILASEDPVASDVAICRLLGHDWRRLQFAAEAEGRGLGRREPIEYVGTPIEEVAVPAWPGHPGLDHLPINVLIGEGVTVPGTVGHLKSVLDSLLVRGELNQIIWLKGTPTILVGDIEDPLFEEHLTEGPYIVVDDCSPARYRNDPRVHFIPGHPVLRTAMPQLLEGLGVKAAGDLVMRWEKFERWGRHNLEYGTGPRKVLTVAKPAMWAAAGLLGVLAGRALVRSIGGHDRARHRRPDS